MSEKRFYKVKCRAVFYTELSVHAENHRAAVEQALKCPSRVGTPESVAVDAPFDDGEDTDADTTCESVGVVGFYDGGAPVLEDDDYVTDDDGCYLRREEYDALPDAPEAA